MADEDQIVVAAAIPKFDMPQYRSKMTATKVDLVVKELGIPLDLHPRIHPEDMTMDQLPEDAIVITMSEYIRFPFTTSMVILTGDVIPAKENIFQNTTPPLPENQNIPVKTDDQRAMEVANEKVLVAKEKKKVQTTRVATKKKTKETRVVGKGRSKPKPNRRKTQAIRKGQTKSSRGTTSRTPIRIAAPFGNSKHSDSDSEGDQADELLHRPRQRNECDDESVYNYIDVDKEKERTGGMGPFMNPAEEACRVDTLMWCREIMVHLATSAAKEDNNALPTPIALERAWFNLDRRVLTKIAKGYRHSVANLMKVIPDPALIDTTSVPSNSAALADHVDPSAQKVT
ncbi:hypothetical protein Tco_0558134 [Tanacetum coccineum]